MSERFIPPPLDAPAAGRRVTLENLSKAYSGFAAVENVSLTLEPGEFLTLLGPSGSGKTSTLMMVAGFESPTRGSIKVDGVDVVAQSPKDRNFGVVFQGYALFPHMTACENVEFPLRMRHIKRGERRRRALEMLEKVGLGAFTQRRPRELSGGQQQRVALARALVFHPDALLLDEPLGALDKNMRERMQHEIKALQRKVGISILFVTHDQDEAMTMSDRIAVMNAGRIVQIGTPQDIYYHPLTAFVASFFGETNLLPCQLVQSFGQYSRVACPSGLTGIALSPRAERPVNENGAALLSIRPERIKILRDTEQADFVVNATVTEHTFLGRHFRIVARAVDEQFAILSNDLDLTRDIFIGKAVRLGWMRDDAQILTTEEETLDPGLQTAPPIRDAAQAIS
jgi:putative spermidine/putrescine transport system ATP-binding protein